MAKRTGLKVRQLAILTAVWVGAGAFITLYDHLLLGTFPMMDGGTSNFALSLAINAGTGLIAAMLGGSFLIFYVNEKCSDKPFIYTVLSIVLFFVLVVSVISFLKSLILNQWGGHDAIVGGNVRIKNAMTWFVVVCLTQLVLSMNRRAGHALLGSIVRGRYNVPQEERKIFMFLDLNASTMMAEKLGDKRYHGLLRDFFSDIADPVLENDGAIYQYVGDEVIVSWNYDDGISGNRCIKCFYDIKRKITSQNAKYLERYGVVPSFKAGFHCGKVVAGEVGILKREITYSGDVLNTTARILSLCQTFGAELIASGNLLSALAPDKTFEILQLGSMKLRGKDKEVSLSAIRGFGYEIM